MHGGLGGRGLNKPHRTGDSPPCCGIWPVTHVYTLLHVPCCLQEELADLSEQQVKHLYGHSGCITGLSYSTDQAVLFSSSADGTVRLWSTQWCKNLAAYRWVAAAV